MKNQNKLRDRRILVRFCKYSHASFDKCMILYNQMTDRERTDYLEEVRLWVNNYEKLLQAYKRRDKKIKKGELRLVKSEEESKAEA